MQLYVFPVVSPINQERLTEELSNALGPVFVRLENGGPDTIGVVLTDDATTSQIETAESSCANHDGTQPSLAQQKTTSDAVSEGNIRNQWQSSALHNKTPQQIFTTMQNQIDGWTSLTQAKADLRVLLPLLFAAIGWTVFREQQRD